MFNFSIISLTLSNNKTKQDIYCKIKEGQQTFQTQVHMDTLTIASWNQNFTINKTSDEVIFQINLWKGENKDSILTETSIKWEQLLSYLNSNQGIKFQNSELTIQITEAQQPVSEAQIQQFQKYLHDTGLEQSFKLIFTEILSRKIDRTEVFTYTALRLRQIGEDLKMFINNNQKMSQLLNNISEVLQDDEPDPFLESQDK